MTGPVVAASGVPSCSWRWWPGPLLRAALHTGLSLTPVPVALLAVLGGVSSGSGEVRAARGR